LNPKICSKETIVKLKAVLANVVKRTGSNCFKDFSMAGNRDGTVNYGKAGRTGMYYASSLWAFQLRTQYSCIVVVHKPNTALNNYYGADVAGPV
jgi:cell division protein FtsI (penicillin-binding protein 3)